jgi:uncharacterized protein YecT (DUF1311 family)
MTSCASAYYHQMDSLLNIVYQKLYLKSDNSGRIKLKTQQLLWLKKRDNYFKQVVAEKKKEAAAEDLLRHFNTMFDLEDMAAFVEKRVVHLIKFL